MRGTSGRARSREQRTARIEQVALELFRSRGFDRVTVEDVCAEAGVGPATFYRHFGTKEGVVFSYRDAFTAALRASIEAAAGAPAPARLGAVLGRFAGFLETQRELLAVRDEIVLGNERLLHRTLVVQRDMEAQLAEGLAALRGVPPSDALVRLEAGLGVLVLRTAVRSWRAGEEDALPAAVDRALADVRGLLAPPPRVTGPGDTLRS
ncbi:TetR/AcrR family transcriptional regulator [Blastococcus litoris]|uniref:TetR/AcrR family transcriptional regulator n=1 Tax=Blastococcus litoris TaxID=2171622 RepID=UPI000E302BE4|nr:TetR/AcrR family transcriptional regulator [Blastococcus litoris]